MSNLLQDFFRPDLTASNRALKKFLDEEGLHLGFRDLVCLRGAAETGTFLSFALLEAWSSGEFGVAEVTDLLERGKSEVELSTLCEGLGWSYMITDENLLLVGVDGELAETDAAPIDHGSVEEGASLVPLSAVYGGNSLLSAPGSGGAWKEDELQAASLTLLDGESEDKLVEAFRHLFRAAPNGTARAAVVATALGRHRLELNREVADKLEEISSPLGQALRQLFTQPDTEGKQALQFLLGAEASAEAPAWTGYWIGIKTTVLESLAGSEKGRQVLRDCLGALRTTAEATGASVLTHRLLDALLLRPELFSAEDRSHLLGLLEIWTNRQPAALDILTSRLQLAGDPQERILLGESLRRAYQQTGREDLLDGLVGRFAQESLSVGSTAGSLALAELLAAFGPRVLEQPALIRLDHLSERQTLNATAMWEQLVSDDPRYIDRVSELFAQAFSDAEHHWGLLLKSPLLQRAPVAAAFGAWCHQATDEQRQRIVSVGQNWTLTVPNRPLIANLLGDLEWSGEELWQQEWRRTTLSFQRLSWLAECLQAQPPTIEPSVETRLLELLRTQQRNPYFWDLMKRLAGFPGLSSAARDRIVVVARSLFRQLEPGLEDDRAALLNAATAALAKSEAPHEIMDQWSIELKSGRADELWWLFGVIESVFSTPGSPFEPERAFLSALLQRLFQSGPDSMQQALTAALDEDDDDLTLPTILSLDLQNLGLQALAAVAWHAKCPEPLQGAVQRRLALFLQQWGDDLARTLDVYSFRSTPLFGLLEPLLDRTDDPELQRLLDGVASTFLRLQRRHPERLRLEVRQSAQSFFACWVAHRDPEVHPEATAWSRLLGEISAATSV